MLKAAAAVLLVGIAVHSGLSLLTQPRFSVHASGAIVMTGASSGIGEHAAASLAKLGYTVFAGVRKKADMERLSSLYPGVRPLRLDVTSPESIQEAVATVTAALKELNQPLVALCNNAGVQKDLPIELQHPDADRFTFAANVFGLLDATRAFLPLLRSTGDGARIVNMGSLSGVVAAPGSATYSASKFAVEGISDALRLEVQPFGISVSLIQPGYVQSKMGAKAHSGSATNYGVTTDQYQLYQGVFEGFLAKDKIQSSSEHAMPPESTTTAAYIDAIRSATPRTRYAVANADGFPAWLIVTLKSLLPDRVFDLLI